MYLKPHGFTFNCSTSNDNMQITNGDLKAAGVSIQAWSTNSYSVWVGDNQVSSSNCGWELTAGDSITLSPVTFGLSHAEIALKDIYVIMSTSGDHVNIGWLERIEDET